MELYFSQRSVNWAKTRQACLQRHVAGMHDFNLNGGGNAEAWAECAACQRHLPIILMDVDHIRDRGGYSQNILDNNLTLWDPANGNDITNDFVFNSMGHAVAVHERVQQHVRTDGRAARPNAGANMHVGKTLATIDSSVGYENDLKNLQWLCGSCNSSKNNSDWNAWIAGTPYAGRVPVPFK